jgi:PAS domain S-box-containing protein
MPMIDPSIYRRLVEQAKEYALFVLDPGGRIMTWNLGAQRLKGYAKEEIVGRHFSVFYPADAVASGWPAHELKVAAREGRFEDEGWRLRKDGSRFWANVVITALRDDNGKLLGFSKLTRDLSERRRHEEALLQSEERFRLLVDGVVDYAIFMLDADGIVTSWNAGAQRIKGYAREEIIGSHFSRFYTDEDVDAGKPWEELALARRDGRAQDEGWRVKKDGSTFWARVVITALYDPQGNLRGFAKVTQDLTQSRHIQDLEKAARNVHEFIAVLTHEVRNPLAPIRNAVQVMAKGTPLPPDQEAMRRTIDRQSAQLSRIVEDMGDIVRISQGKLPMASAPVSLAAIVQRALEAAAPLIEAARHRVALDLPAEDLMVDGDADRLTQLLTNLLRNAARYTPDQGGIEVRAQRDAGSALVAVRDTGRGIPADMQERIFDMFVQGREPLERVDGGLGVGLALARRIAEAHGGTLTVSSEGEGKGSEFTLRMPLSEPAPNPVRNASGPGREPAPQQARRVLVVDDNVDAGRTLGELLNALGHETRVVHDGPSALAMADAFRPDVVLLDIGMPGMDGYEVARRLSALQEGRRPRIVAVTGWSQESDRHQASEAGFDMHLVKPVDLDALLRALDHRGGATLH